MTTGMLSGNPSELGAHYDGNGVNFALYSASAQRVELCLFDPHSHQQTQRFDLPMLSDNVWHGYLPGLEPGQLYGYRVDGDYNPQAGLWFNPNKVVIDPYARKLTGSVRLTDLHFAYANADDPLDGEADPRDNAHVMPKCVVVAPHTNDVRRTNTGFYNRDELIYEAHLKGLTQQHPAIPADIRGRYLAAAHPAIIEHLNQLGITSLELLPVFSFVTEPHLLEKGLSNYWGYNPVNFFCPHLAYALDADQASCEFSQMCAQLNTQGVDVILDVVYNHTAEGDQFGPMLSFKGIDNPTYYRLDDQGRYVNHSGCGNTLNLANKQVLKLVMASLRYWVQHMGVNGFRFDLASILGREHDDQFNQNAAFFQTLEQDPVLTNIKLIAEPWDIGPQGHQTGQFPAPFSQWNDYYRDGIRHFWQAEHPNLAEFADLILGSSKRFEHSSRGRKSWASLNFITAHDGFTLNDLVSFTHKHNQANQENNRDGHNHNLSVNHGVEGKTDDPHIINAREQHCRNLIATLLLSQGVPMLLAGDEFLNTQQGNNNAYCQDNPIGWLDWDKATRHEDLLAFTGYLARLRSQHSLLRLKRYIHRGDTADGPGVEWLKADGRPMEDSDWHDPAIHSLALQLSLSEPVHIEHQGARSMLLLVNAGSQNQPFTLPPPGPQAHWQAVIDTQHARTNDMQTRLETAIELAANSLVLALHHEQTTTH